jgi:hypothetical protein
MQILSIVVKQDTYLLAKQMKHLQRKGTYTKV